MIMKPTFVTYIAHSDPKKIVNNTFIIILTKLASYTTCLYIINCIAMHQLTRRQDILKVFINMTGENGLNLQIKLPAATNT